MNEQLNGQVARTILDLAGKIQNLDALIVRVDQNAHLDAFKLAGACAQVMVSNETLKVDVAYGPAATEFMGVLRGVIDTLVARRTERLNEIEARARRLVKVVRMDKRELAADLNGALTELESSLAAEENSNAVKQ